MNQQPIESLKGIGDKTGALFRKLDLHTIENLLHYYPRGYDAYMPPVSMAHLKVGGMEAVCGTIDRPVEIKRIRNLQVITTTVKDGTGKLSLTWFNMPFLRATLKTGETYIFRGKITKKLGRYVMEQPEIFSRSSYDVILHSMQPIYGQTKGLGNKAITKAVTQALEQREMEREYLPPSLRSKYELAEYNFAIEHIHFPKDQKELLFARKRLVFDEFLFFLMTIRFLKENRVDKCSRFPVHRASKVEEIRANLPYQLTAAQNNVLEEVMGDLESGRVMNRLIQGDVGSGKTIIAVLALLQVAFCGYQGALMVPTEVLARQHFESITGLITEHGIQKEVILVTGSMTAKEKRIAYEKIRSHEVDVIIGTHALIQEKVEYHNLALVITDEQHRFGVGQREALGGKGDEPHVLVMSATPIPRTLAIILYGDLDISIIDELPANRLPIKNCVVDTGYREKAYQFIEKEVACGRQAYVICPMVEESELMEAENVLDYTKLLRTKLPNSIAIAYLHGKMKPKEKNQIMERFAAGEIQVLVSTTVVEVGVNVPNATIMMIENAERFGLAQLHQLRGRVGRGKYQSYCIMVNASDQEGTQERLDILNRSNDGFYIASEDLKLRGPGDIFGLRQSGDMEFKIADIFTDANLLKTVSEEVNQLLSTDPELLLPEHQELKQRMKIYVEKSSERMNL